jgi:glycosyltransferase involved in cell wall biosynthesis
MPTFSIITATFNAAATIVDCLQSVASQTHPTEHIIIDGTSTDATLETIRRISPRACILSEPDRGIYDAMNKGIALATGDIIGILNADDFYADPDVLERVAAVFTDPTVDACYGDLEYVRDSEKLKVKSEKTNPSPVTSQDSPFTVTRYWKSDTYTPGSFYWGWMPPHPTFFVRRSVYERYGKFRLDMGSAADYELMLRLLLKQGLRAAYIPEVLVRMRVGGASNRSLAARLAANRMDRRAWEINELKPYPWTFMMKPLRKVGQYFLRQF